MTDEEDQAARNKREMRAMWIFSAVIVLAILGGMGAQMLWGHHPPATTDISSQTRAAPAK